MMIKTIVSAMAGIILGIIASRYLLVGSPLSLIPWAMVGFLIGIWSERNRTSIINGGIYGFLLAFTFMIAGYQGTEPVASRIPFFAALGLLGAVCGIILALIGSILKNRIGRTNSNRDHDQW